VADACLVPAAQGADRSRVEMGALPTVVRVFERLVDLDAVRRAHWENQGDTPGKLR
jgi:maleylacetoacetate isomerase